MRRFQLFPGAVSAFQPVPSSSNPHPLPGSSGIIPRSPPAAAPTFQSSSSSNSRRRRSRNSSTGSESSARNNIIVSDEDEEANAKHQDGEDTEEITDTELEKKKNGQEVDRFTWPSGGGYDERM